MAEVVSGRLSCHNHLTAQLLPVVLAPPILHWESYGWRIPLWDGEILDFWKDVPLQYKVNQKLYKETLINDNWGEVWRDIDINPLIIAKIIIIKVGKGIAVN